MTYLRLQAAAPASTTRSHALTPTHLRPYVLMYMPHSSRFHQPHPSKRNKKLGQTYCPKSRRCRATKHGLTPGSSSTASCACAQTQMQAPAETPLESHSLLKGRNETIRCDTTRHHSCIQQPTAQRIIQPFADFRFMPCHHLTSGTLASRKPDCVLASTSPICARWHYYFSTTSCRVGCVKWMGFNALADAWRPRACGMADAADQVVHAGLHYMRVYATMHICMQAVGWATGAWRGQSVCSVEFHPNSCAVTFCGDFFAV